MKAKSSTLLVEETHGWVGFVPGSSYRMTCVWVSFNVVSVSAQSASVFASTAASFAIEQRGLPRIDCHGQEELWNDINPWSRLKEMVKMVNEAA